MIWHNYPSDNHFTPGRKQTLFTFFVVDAKNEIIIGHPASDRHWITKVLCHNKARKGNQTEAK